MRQARRIEKIYLLVHPLTYIDHEDEYGDKEFFNLALKCENEVCQRWYKRISEIKENEMLVLLPSRPETKSMKRLQDFSEQQLGNRCVILNLPNIWQDRPDSFYRFVGKEARDTLINRQSLDSSSVVSAMDFFAFSVSAYCYVENLRRELQSRGLVIDTQTVKAESWGESFDGCVAKYSQGLGMYLGLKDPFEENFEMTVPDAVFLLQGVFVEKIKLPHGVRLFLFQSEDRTPIGVFFETFRKGSEEIRVINVPADSAKIRVCNRYEQELWPGEESESRIKVIDKCLQVPLINGIDYLGYFIFGRGLTCSQLREVLMNSFV